MFGIPLTILNIYALEESQLIEPIFGVFYIDLLVNQYLLALGVSYVGGYNDYANKGLVWFIYFCATFFTQITMLNMLIAIMGDTFDKVTE